MSVQRSPLTALAQTDADFAAWLERWRAKRDAEDAKIEALEAQTAQIDLSNDERLGRLITAREEKDADRAMLDAQLFFEVVCRHFPGIAPALRTVWEHAIEQYSDEMGSYCADALEPW
jgi:hypothetical protein